MADASAVGVDARCWVEFCLQLGVDADSGFVNFGIGAALASPGLIIQGENNNASNGLQVFAGWDIGPLTVRGPQ